MLWGITASTVFLVALALFASSAVAAVGLSFLIGVSAFATAPALNARMFNVAGAAPTLAGATTTAAFNLGNTGGPWLGGAVIDAGRGFAAPAWAGAAMTVTAIALGAIALRLHTRAPQPPTRVIASSAPQVPDAAAESVRPAAR